MRNDLYLYTTEIEQYKETIAKLEEMKSIYEGDGVYLYGGYYTEMMDVINGQIEDCHKFIANIQSYINEHFN